jgi:hypothetical protein
MNNHLRLWVDDLRNPEDFGHEGWSWAKNYSEAITCLQLGEVLEISLDHDLGDYDATGREFTGYDVAYWMAERGIWPPDGAKSHSANPVGRGRIEAMIKRYGPY